MLEDWPELVGPYEAATTVGENIAIVRELEKVGPLRKETK